MKTNNIKRKSKTADTFALSGAVSYFATQISLSVFNYTRSSNDLKKVLNMLKNMVKD